MAGNTGKLTRKAMPEFDESGTIMRDDWFAFTFDHNHAECHRKDPLTGCEPISHTVHELCQRTSCIDPRFRECPFHPIGCNCSFGACQMRLGNL
jgi:hypothetical protein